MIWAGGRGGGTSHPGLALGKFLTHRLAGENRRFFKQPGKSECVSDLCDFFTRTAFVQSKSLTTPPVRVYSATLPVGPPTGRRNWRRETISGVFPRVLPSLHTGVNKTGVNGTYRLG